MGIFFSRKRSEEEEQQIRQQLIVVEHQRRRRIGLAVAAHQLLLPPGQRFQTVTDLLRVVIAARDSWVISSPFELASTMNELEDLERQFDFTDEEYGEYGHIAIDYEDPLETSLEVKPHEPRLVKSAEYLKTEVAIRAGTKNACCSVLANVCRRELGIRERPQYSGAGCAKLYKRSTNESLGGFSASKLASLGNKFLPNRRKIIDKLRTKTFCCYYPPNGTTLLTASQDEMIRIYERKGYRQKYVLRDRIQAPYVGWSILDLIVSPDGRHCVYGTWSEKMYQCRLDGSEEDGQRWSALNVNSESDEERFAFFSLRFNNDGSQILGGASDGYLYIYDREKNTKVVSVFAHDDDVNAVCFGDAAGHLFFSAGDDGLCKVWDRRALADDNRPVGAFAGHRDGIAFIDSKGDDRYLLTHAKDQTIKLWDIRCFSSLTAQDETKKSVSRQGWDYRYQPVPRGLYTHQPLKDDGSVCTFRGGHSVLHTLIRAHFSPPHTGQRYIYTGCARGNCVIYDILDGSVVAELSGHKAVVRDCAWHPSDNEIVTTSWDGVTAVWRFDDRMKVRLSGGNVDEDEETSDECYNPRSKKKRNAAESSNARSHKSRRFMGFFT